MTSIVDILTTFYNAIKTKFATKEDVKQPDYTQNDSTAADYIKNRPFYSEIGEVTLLDGTFDFVEQGSGLYVYGQESSLIFEEGKTYTVVFDGTSYSCTGYIPDVRVPVVLGNASIGGLSGGNNEPFLMITGNGHLQIGTNLTDSSHTVKITSSGEIVKKLDAKYLPDEIRETPSSKMDKSNPTGTGSFSLNRKSDTTVGDYSFAEGCGTTASGESSHAEGCNTTSSGYASHAEGEGTTASGGWSHSEGYSTGKFSSVVTKTDPTNGDIIAAWKNKKFSLAKGDNSHVEGKNSLALGDYSHAEGGSTTASGSYSHAEGSGTTASDMFSHAEGRGTTASGESSHAEGVHATASGYYSHAEGVNTKASSNSQHVQGKYNIEDSLETYADIIGNGIYETKRSNASTVDWSGNAWYAGDVYVGSTSGTNKDEGSKKLATEEYVDTLIGGIENGSY